MKRFKIGETVRYRRLECYGKVVHKDKRNPHRLIYTIKLDKNVDGEQYAYDDGTTLEHLSN